MGRCVSGGAGHAGETNDARIINTTSVSGIYGNPGQDQLRALAGIAIHDDRRPELACYGVTVNASLPLRSLA
ncbi:MAG: hypothetical protein R2710_05290 [Acidimicrobiales bacterium]